MFVITYRKDREKTIRDLDDHEIRYGEPVLVNWVDAKAKVIA